MGGSFAARIAVLSHPLVRLSAGLASAVPRARRSRRPSVPCCTLPRGGLDSEYRPARSGHAQRQRGGRGRESRSGARSGGSPVRRGTALAARAAPHGATATEVNTSVGGGVGTRGEGETPMAPAVLSPLS